MDKETGRILIATDMAKLRAKMNPAELADATSKAIPINPTADSGGGRPPKLSRNDPCPCGSGKKFKKCCESIANETAGVLRTLDQKIETWVNTTGTDQEVWRRRARILSALRQLMATGNLLAIASSEVFNHNTIRQHWPDGMGGLVAGAVKAAIKTPDLRHRGQIGEQEGKTT